MSYVSLFGEIAELAGLHFTGDIPVEYSDEVRQGFLVAVDTGVLFDKRREEELFQPVDKSVTDLLGDYFPEERKVIIYTKVCESTANSLGLRYDHLEYVVAAHEISHAITHLGEERFPGSGIIWDWYPYADLWDKELFAQLYPFLHFGHYGKREVLDVFQKLSANQLPIYNSWKPYRHIPLHEVNELLSLTRLRRFCAWINLDPPAVEEKIALP